MTDFQTEVKRIEQQIKDHGYDEKAERQFRRRWAKLAKR